MIYRSNSYPQSKDMEAFDYAALMQTSRELSDKTVELNREVDGLAFSKAGEKMKYPLKPLSSYDPPPYRTPIVNVKEREKIVTRR